MPSPLDLPDVKTSAAEVSRNFGQWQDIALSQPVLVTHHGRPRVVILSSDEYRKLRGRQHDAGDPLDAALMLDGVSTLSAHMLEGFVWLDADLHVRGLNAVAAANMGLDVDAAVTLDFDALARDNESLAALVARLRRVLRTAEPTRFEMAGVTGSGRTYSMCAFPFRGGVAYTYLQETEVQELRSLAGRWRSELDAVNLLYEVAILRVSPAGYIEQSNAFLSDLLGFAQSDLERMRLIDLVAEADRQEVAAGVADLFSGAKDSFAGVCSLMVNTRGAARLKIACTPVRQNGVCVAVTLVGLEV